MPYIYNRKWRDVDENEAPKDVKPVLDLKAKLKEILYLKI